MSWRIFCGQSSITAQRAYGTCALYSTIRICPSLKCSRQRLYSTSRVRRYEQVHSSEPEDGKAVTIRGLVRSIRKQKKVAFIHISDGTTLEPIQAILNPSQAEEITNGSYVELAGIWQSSPGKGQAFEVHVKEVDNIGQTEPDVYPIQKKSQTADFLRSLPHLRIRTPFYSLLARTRSQLISGVHEYYNGARRAGPAIQVHPPLVTSSDCEGAGEVFTISPKSSKSLPSAGEQNTPLYFRDHKYLTVSSQLHLEAYAAELGDVWTLSPTFRAEESDTPRHLSEFYMLEAEFRSVNSLQHVMSEAQELLQHLVRTLAESRAGQDLINYHSDPKYTSSENNNSTINIQERWKTVLTSEWPSLSYTDAIQFLRQRYEAQPGIFTHTPNYETGLQLEHERFLVTEFANNVPLFVTNYPKHIKPFYMLPSDASSDVKALEADQTVACFDLLFPHGTAEIVGGSLREHRLPNLIAAMREKGLIKRNSRSRLGSNDGEENNLNTGSPDLMDAEYPFLEPGESLGSMQWYADLRRFGTSPHGGFGMGFDRLLAYVCGVSNIRDTVGFPRYYGRADC